MGCPDRSGELLFRQVLEFQRVYVVALQREEVHPIVRKLATATCVVALLPIGLGALVTTMKAGMAFADWPSSDGQNMLLYPWLRDFASNPDKFTEHGHRLAGVLIGLVSISLAVAGWVLETRWVRLFVTTILVAVIVQGMLGGARVLLDRQVLAMIHSITGASFFSLCVVFRLLCGSQWSAGMAQRETQTGPFSAALIAIAPVAVLGQYFLGGMLRHMHTMLNEHLIGAVVVGLVTLVSATCMMRSENALMRKSGYAVASVLLLQLLLGAGSYVARFGLPMIGYVATAGSLAQAVVCSMHTVVGMLLLASTVVSAMVLGGLSQAGCLGGLRIPVPVLNDRGSVA